jgi:hypothetical protein
MPHYRVYMLNRIGRTVTDTDVVCADDPTAFAWAATALGLNARAEIWRAERCLGGLSDGTAPPDRVG